MSATFSATVYQINTNQPLATPVVYGFPSAQCFFRPAPSGTKSAANVDLYGIIQVLPTGLNIEQPQYYVVESVAQLVVKSNA